jgi:hypothetical protein
MISFNWLLYGKGEMLKSLANYSPTISSENAIVPEEKVDDSPTTDAKSVLLNANQEVTTSAFFEHTSSNKKIIKVLFFYQDNTFEEFTSGK